MAVASPAPAVSPAARSPVSGAPHGAGAAGAVALAFRARIRSMICFVSGSCSSSAVDGGGGLLERGHVRGARHDDGAALVAVGLRRLGVVRDRLDRPVPRLRRGLARGSRVAVVEAGVDLVVDDERVGLRIEGDVARRRSARSRRSTTDSMPAWSVGLGGSSLVGRAECREHRRRRLRGRRADRLARVVVRAAQRPVEAEGMAQALGEQRQRRPRPPRRDRPACRSPAGRRRPARAADRS